MSAAFDMAESFTSAPREAPFELRSITPAEWLVLGDLVPELEFREEVRRAGPRAEPSGITLGSQSAEHMSACKRAIAVASRGRVWSADWPDLTQELALRLFEFGKPRDFEAWLFVTAGNLIEGFLRKEARRRELRDEDNSKNPYRRTGPNWRPKWYSPHPDAVQNAPCSYDRGGAIMHCKGSPVGGPAGADEVSSDPARRPAAPVDVEGLLVDVIDHRAWDPGGRVGPGDVRKFPPRTETKSAGRVRSGASSL